MPSIGWQELVIVLLILVVVFGSRRLPEFGSAIGKAYRNFKDGLKKEHRAESQLGETKSIEPASRER